MHLMMDQCVKVLMGNLEQVASSPSAVINAKDIFTGFTIDVSLNQS